MAPLIAGPTLPPELENDAVASRCPNLLQKPVLPASGPNHIQKWTVQRRHRGPYGRPRNSGFAAAPQRMQMIYRPRSAPDFHPAAGRQSRVNEALGSVDGIDKRLAFGQAGGDGSR